MRILRRTPQNNFWKRENDGPGRLGPPPAVQKFDKFEVRDLEIGDLEIGDLEIGGLEIRDVWRRNARCFGTED